MKKIVFLLFLTLLLSGCFYNSEIKTGIISLENDLGIDNSIKINEDYYGVKTEITFHDPKDIENFKKELSELNNEINSNTGSITYDQIISKARVLDYLGETGESLKLYEQNFNIDNNGLSLAYNHNLAKFYEKLGLNNDALSRYDFLINYFNRKDYFKDVAEIWKSLGDEGKYEKAINEYNKLKGK